MRIFIINFLVFLAFSAMAQRPLIFIDPDAHLTKAEKAELKKKRDNYTLQKVGATIRTPAGFSPLNQILPYYCRTNPMDYAYVNPDSSIIVTVAINVRDSAAYLRDVKVMKRLRGDSHFYNPELQWILDFKGRADSSTFKPIFYSPARLRKYNADGGVEFYKEKCDELFLGSYRPARQMIVHKSYRGFFDILYFTRDGAIIKDGTIEKIVRNGSKMVFFNK